MVSAQRARVADPARARAGMGREELVAGYVSARMPGAGVLPDLDLSTLSGSAREAAESRISAGTSAAWSDAAKRVQWCSHPVRLRGSSVTVDTATGAVENFASSNSGGEARVPCGNRRAIDAQPARASMPATPSS